MDYLYHGSEGLYTELIPKKAMDEKYIERNLKAVYATTSKWMAICFALGKRPGVSGNISREISEERGKVIIFHEGKPNIGGVGYIYKLKRDGFIHIRGTQWVSFSPVKPIEVEKILVNDYLDYCIIKETDENHISIFNI